MKAKIKALLIAISLITVIVTVCSSCSMVFGAFGDQASVDKIVLDIKATNLSFSNSVFVKYAVECGDEVTNTDDVKMLIWLEAQDEYVKGTELVALDNIGTEEYAGKNCLIFAYSGFAASQMTDVVYARAYVVIDGKTYYSDAKKYSILQYAYNKLGKTSVATDNEELKTLLEDMLSYGALAQQYTNYKTGSLATDNFYQIKVAGGTLADGFNHGLYKEGEQVTITAPQTSNGAEFIAWRDRDGNVISENNTHKVTVGNSNTVYFAVYEVQDASANLQYMPNEDESAYILTGIGNCADKDVVIPSKIYGKLVTHIADGAFANCTDIESVRFGTAIVEIGDNVFSGCTSLTTVYYEGSRAILNSVPKGTNWDGGLALKFKYTIDDSWEIGGIPLN